MHETELKEAFAKVREGDKDAFTLIYNEMKHVVFTVVWRIVRRKETAEDITADVFVKLYVSPPDSSIRNVRAWIFRMARNQAIDELRKSRSVSMDEHDPTDEDTTDALEWKWDIESALTALPDTERQIVSLHLNGELSFAETARIIGLSLPAVYRKYRKAIKTLRDHFTGGNV